MLCFLADRNIDRTAYAIVTNSIITQIVNQLIHHPAICLDNLTSTFHANNYLMLIGYWREARR